MINLAYGSWCFSLGGKFLDGSARWYFNGRQVHDPTKGITLSCETAKSCKTHQNSCPRRYFPRDFLKLFLFKFFLLYFLWVSSRSASSLLDVCLLMAGFIIVGLCQHRREARQHAVEIKKNK